MNRIFIKNFLKYPYKFTCKNSFFYTNKYSINFNKFKTTFYIFSGCLSFYYIYNYQNFYCFHTSYAFSLFNKSQKNNQITNNQSSITLKSAMEYSDRKDKDVEKAYNDLKLFENDSNNNFDLCWRLSRACIQYASKVDLDADFSKLLYQQAVEYAKKALSLNSWSSIAHLRAIEFNPADPFAHHMLAMWHYTVADYSLLAKMIAVVIFGGGPVLTSFHDALMKFEDAERIQPNFMIKNHLMLGKTNSRIGNYAAARKWLDHCLKMPTTCSEDSQIKEDAMFLINYLDQVHPL